MSETKHTPWELGRVEDGHGMLLQDTAVVFTADGGQIEVSETPHADEIARMIAAAPDLLAAATKADQFLDHLKSSFSQGVCAHTQAMMKELKAALSRATPREGE